MNTGIPDTTRSVAFEGVEGAGKSTVVRRVSEHLESLGEEVVVVREPGGTGVGEAIRAILLDGDLHPIPRAEAALFAAARGQLIGEIVIPALARGAWVLSDRTVYSSLAYQAAGRGLPFDEVRTLNDIAIGGVWPGRVVLLRVGSDTGLGRQSVSDRIGDETEAFHEAVATAFDRLAESDPDRFVVVDAERPLSEVLDAVVRELDRPWGAST
jgi:dTMP kinase